MTKLAGLGAVVLLGIILIIKMLVLGRAVNSNNAPPPHNPGPNYGPIRPLDSKGTKLDPMDAADPVRGTPQRDPISIAPKPGPDTDRGYDPNFLNTAALQAWFGQDKELAATCDRTLKHLKDTTNAALAEKAAKICSLRPLDEKTHESALVLAQRAVELGKGNAFEANFQMALGMAEYRSGNYANADAALLAAFQIGKGNYYVSWTSAFYRAMSLFQQGKEVEARKLAAEAISKMKPLPLNERYPLSGKSNADDLILWMAYKEAKELLKLMR
jgi:tetratricopeptide (TPR) repeat protein